MYENYPEAVLDYEGYPELAQAQPYEARFQSVCVNDFMAEDIPPRKCILSPWLPEQGLAMIYAPRGIGKTFFSLEIAQAVASGSSFSGWQAQRAAPVLYLDGEMAQADLQERFKAIAQGKLPIAKDYFRIVTPDKQAFGMPNLSDPRSHALIRPMVEDAKLIIVDNISTLCRGGSENDAESWDIVQNWALGLKAQGRSVMFIHHAGKSGGQRGTSKREDVLDTVINLKRPSDYQAKEGARFEVHFEKARGFSGPESEPFELSLQTEGEGYRWDQKSLEDSTYHKVIKLAKQEGMSQSDIANEVGVNKSTVSRHMQTAKNNGVL